MWPVIFLGRIQALSLGPLVGVQAIHEPNEGRSLLPFGLEAAEVGEEGVAVVCEHDDVLATGNIPHPPDDFLSHGRRSPGLGGRRR